MSPIRVFNSHKTANFMTLTSSRIGISILWAITTKILVSSISYSNSFFSTYFRFAFSGWYAILLSAENCKSTIKVGQSNSNATSWWELKTKTIWTSSFKKWMSLCSWRLTIITSRKGNFSRVLLLGTFLRVTRVFIRKRFIKLFISLSPTPVKLLFLKLRNMKVMGYPMKRKVSDSIAENWSKSIVRRKPRNKTTSTMWSQTITTT